MYFLVKRLSISSKLQRLQFHFISLEILHSFFMHALLNSLPAPSFVTSSQLCFPCLLPCFHSPHETLIPAALHTGLAAAVEAGCPAVVMNESWKEYGPRDFFLKSYLSFLCRISFPFFQRLIAGGEAWGLHSRVTSLPKRAFSRALSGLLEKLGGEAVCWEITWNVCG